MGLIRLPVDAPQEEILQAFGEHGGLIVKKMIPVDVIAVMRDAILKRAAHVKPGTVTQGLDDTAKVFLGHKTTRFSSLGRLSPAYFNIIENTTLLSVADRFLKPGNGDYWINTGQAMLIGPGEKAQPRHRDCFNWSIFCLTCWPNCPEITVSSMIALDDVTEELGATRVIPGSHRWTNRHELGGDSDTVAAEMEAGDALIYSGKLVHGAGENRTKNRWRLAMHVSYVAGWLVPEEASMLDYSLDEIKKLSPRCQRLLGYRSFDPRPNPGGGLWLKDVDRLEHAYELERG